MSDPSSPRTVPGPPRPAPAPAGASPEPDTSSDSGAGFADLDERPVAEHVAVFEAEHERLQRELGTIDRL